MFWENWFKKKKIEQPKVNIQYAPLKNITTYELAWLIHLFALDRHCSLDFLLGLIKKHKLGRHFEFNGNRGR